MVGERLPQSPPTICTPGEPNYEKCLFDLFLRLLPCWAAHEIQHNIPYDNQNSQIDALSINTLHCIDILPKLTDAYILSFSGGNQFNYTISLCNIFLQAELFQL